MMNNKMLNYLNDVKLFNKFINKLNNENYNIKNNESDFWNILFLLCRSYLNDNFHKMYRLTNDNYLELVFSQKVTINNYLDTTFMVYNKDILKLLLDNQFFKTEPNINDHQLLFRLIRNHLSHYNYNINNKIISFKDTDYNVSISFSIATLVLILLATLSNLGQSNKMGAYESSLLLFKSIPFEMKVTNNKENNDITPIDVQMIINESLKMSNSILKTLDDEGINIYIENLCGIIEKNNNVKIDIYPIDNIINDRIDNYYIKNSLYDFVNQIISTNIYFMLKDEIKKSTITFKLYIALLYTFYINKNNIDYFKVYLPILENEIIIYYMNIVFCDYAISINNNISNEYFDYLDPSNCKKIPRKLRNSLSHCHYRFQDITDSSSNVIIEFWDEYEKTINFECKIKKENVIKLIEKYIEEIKKIK